jgi:aryl-phospho-beta-D-glucosidase BglC (GH1 family)
MRQTYRAGFWKRSRLAFWMVIVGIVILSGCTLIPFPGAEPAAAPCPAEHHVGFLTASHGQLLDASGCLVHLSGVNWLGFETRTFAPHGLTVRNWQDMLKQIAHTSFNTIRLPYATQLFDPASQPEGINYWLNPDLKGLRGLALMYHIIQGAGQLGLKVILDRHDPTADLRPALWYTDQVPKLADLAHTLAAVWQKHWAYLQQMWAAPVLLGEFGGRSMGQDMAGIWQRTLVTFLKTNTISYTYWSWNPDSGDTGGILQDDWKTVNQSKFDVWNAYQWPMLGQPESDTNNHPGAIPNAYRWPGK